MSLDPNDGFVAAEAAEPESGDLPIFTIERVQLQFSIAADFAAAQVANNVIILALSSGRILRIDLNRPEDIDDIDLPRKPSEIGIIRRMFLDPTASHLLVCTSLGHNFYLHSQSKQPRLLSKLPGVLIESIAWNPSLPTASTREILIGTVDGNIYEAFIETSNEFYRKEMKHLKNLHKLPDGPITGLWVDNLHGKNDLRRVMIATQSRLFHLVGRISHGHDGSGSIYTRMFETEQPVIHELSRVTSGASSTFVVSPDPPDTSPHDDDDVPDRAYAWLSSHGVYHGKLLNAPADSALGSKVFAESKMLPRAQIVTQGSGSKRKPSTETIDAIALTQWHIVNLVGGRVITTNRLTGEMVSEHDVLSAGQKPIGFSVDSQKNTFWLFTSEEIFEIVVRDEDRNIWKIMMETQQFEPALQQARSQIQRETVSAAFGDYLSTKGHWSEAAMVYGRSNKPFEEVALKLIDSNQPDALRIFLLTKLGTTKKSAVMQRIMIASWLVEIFMAKLNSLDDAIITHADLSEKMNPAESRKLINSAKKEFQEFVNNHGREEELLYFANAINDYNYVLSYWVQRERWTEALNVLKKQTDAEIFYRYSTVLMSHVAQDTVDILMRHSDLSPRRLIPALLEYHRGFDGEATAQNQAIRYLNYVVYQLNSTDAAVHNTLVSIYASHPSKDESGLLSYLQAQGDEPRYDSDFALRQCIHHHRTLSCVHIYTSMEQYLQAVDLALSHNEVELAAVIADRPMSNPQLRKRLWLAVARRVISQSDGIKTAIEFLKRCDLLKIEDLIPFFPDFVVIDDFKEEICEALEDYSRNIDNLKKEMDESSQTATNIKLDIAALDHRYAIVEPVLEQAGVAKSNRIKELQMQIHKGLVSGTQREAVVAELDALVASACILCSDFAIKRIDEPFITRDDNPDEWAL
ncbi:pep3/Vps18/deep orange family domain-containing protein [Trichoderma breve]|uniref:Pep3/Vps18/deep orange family domain-containing protein n=1 Tax=Trichoderma breve TaxID=2034170 RepID=A0A9W9B8B0_9HYPO|nr:pep3/Vps18/deep orange family domain-containing protein [Trichoderma breve]KAJ4858355.1 pep3/Vps18/deep orange family domain-containing protein [Trichoderma breve]